MAATITPVASRVNKLVSSPLVANPSLNNSQKIMGWPSAPKTRLDSRKKRTNSRLASENTTGQAATVATEEFGLIAVDIIFPKSMPCAVNKDIFECRLTDGDRIDLLTKRLHKPRDPFVTLGLFEPDRAINH